jgi:hypothetical protein
MMPTMDVTLVSVRESARLFPQTLVNGDLSIRLKSNGRKRAIPVAEALIPHSLPPMKDFISMSVDDTSKIRPS